MLRKVHRSLFHNDLVGKRDFMIEANRDHNDSTQLDLSKKYTRI
jgi:hypothetical protein